ncbi:MAG: DUF1127 domain-containing protein [Rhizobiaceae bacterium]|nr:DUF1127 domain-containing protein [Rhizobiaceae bacterium]
MNVINNIRSWNNTRKAYNELNRLSNRELFDIGIHRSEIPNIARNSILR